MKARKKQRPVLHNQVARKKSRFLLKALAAAFTVGIAAIVSVWALHQWGQSQTYLEKEAVFDFQRGTSLNRLAQELEKLGLLEHPLYFRIYVRLFAEYPRFKAGLYQFSGQTSPQQIVNKFTKGEIYEPIILQYNIPEGFTYNKVAERLVSLNVASRDEFDSIWQDENFRNILNIPSSTLEGYLFPATYSFVKMIGAREAIKSAVDTFWKKLPGGYRQEVSAMGLTLNEAVTFASLIELETLHDDERPLVSEVIWRRLKRREPIAIDAALIYGIQGYAGDLKWEHLKDKKNPYNTRIHKGLPPTPVGSPGTASLKAVLNPTNYGYYYYVRDVETANRHHFSKTLAEHNKYVRKLVAAEKKK